MNAVLEVSRMQGTLRNGVPTEVNWMLECWARWAKTHANELGWPQSTILARIIEYGLNGASSAGRPPITMPSDVAEVDRILAKMPQHLRKVIVVHYTTWSPLDEKAKEVGISRSAYRNRLESAQWYVYARLQ